MIFNVTSPKRDTELVVQLINDNWINFVFVYKQTTSKTLFELKELNWKPSLSGYDTDHNSDKIWPQYDENRMCGFCKTRWFKWTLVIMEKTSVTGTVY